MLRVRARETIECKLIERESMINFSFARFVTLILLIGLQVACSGIDIHVAAEPGFNAAAYRHYAWKTAPLIESRDTELLQIDRTVRAAVDGELQRRGFILVANDAADALLDYRLSSHMDFSQAGGSGSPRDDLARASDPERNSANNTALYNHPILPYIERIELLLSVQARSSGIFLWQGSAVKNVDDVNQRFSSADIQRAVTLLLNQLKITK